MKLRNFLLAAAALAAIPFVLYGLPALAQSASQSGFYWGDSYIGSTKHWADGSALQPVATSCGTGSSLATGSGDNSGDITLGSGTTACILTFGKAFTAAPTCVAMVSSGSSATQPQYQASTTALHINVGVASTKYSYICRAKATG